MKLVLFGSTGMIGHGALLEALDDPGVEQVLAIVRKPSGRRHDKLVELVHPDFTDYSDVLDALRGYDACLWCLGVSAAGLSEAEYRHITLDLAVIAGKALLQANPEMRLCFISGAGTDPGSRTMWARVKGEAEQAMAALPWAAAHSFRPGMIQPRRGVRSQTPQYQLMYTTMGWMLPLWRKLFPAYVTTTEILGRALIRVARDGWPEPVLESVDINRAGEAQD